MNIDAENQEKLEKQASVNKAAEGSLLQKALKEKMRQAGFSAHLLEKQAGLKRSSVQNILQGRSRKPSAEILYAISKVLGCSLNDLLGEFDISGSGSRNLPKQLLTTPTSLAIADAPLNIALYADAARIANEIFAQQEITASRHKALGFIEEIYSYSLENKLISVDTQFARWLAKKWFISPSNVVR